MPAGSPSTGSGATSHSNPVIVRNVGVTRRDSISIASVPSRNRVSQVAALDLLVGRHDTVERAEVEEPLQCLERARIANANLVGAASSSTSSPPFDQTNGATRMISGSTPSPQTSTSPSPSIVLQ